LNRAKIVSGHGSTFILAKNAQLWNSALPNSSFRMSRFLLAFLTIPLALLARASDPYPRNLTVDVIHYQFQLRISDESNEIIGEASVEVLFLAPGMTTFELDLVGQAPGEKTGMRITSLTSDQQAVTFSHQSDRIRLQLSAPTQANEKRTFRIAYRGIPEDGLIISANQYGDRTFFGDNWPNRAHYWLPTVDYPSDKATCEFMVTAPRHYQVIANGLKISETDTATSDRITHWKESVPIPTKVMVFGAARFSVDKAGEVNGKEIQSWVFPQNQKAGFYDYALAVPILQFMQERIGPYSYEKLANVQSKTRYGGMENASCIFYAENTISGKRSRDLEGLLAHEIAHQWFGNSASELDWHHVWLSEGFATYLTQVYMEATYGPKQLAEGMKAARSKVLAYYQNTPLSPIVDTTVTDLTQLLNPNSYEKGAWFLHMLRHKLGDKAFFQGIRNYYQQYQNKNALTADFQRVMEEASGKPLQAFFRQWLFQAGQPLLKGLWQYNKTAKKLTIQLRQTQPGALFNTPLEIGFYDTKQNLMKLSKVEINQREQTLVISLATAPASVVPDPHTWLLIEAILEKK
jgi:aminopeptidase N